MAYNQQTAFWDFIRSLDQSNGTRNNGEGVDRPAPSYAYSWPYGYGHTHDHWPGPPPPPEHEDHPPPPPPPHEPHGPHGPRGPGHHGHHPPPPPPPGGFGPGFPFGHHGPPHRGGPFGGPRGGCHGRGGRRGRHGRRESRHRGERGDPDNEEGGEQQGPWGAFDLSGLLASLASHPLAQPYRHFFEGLAAQAQDQQQSGETARDGAEGEEENSFTPPIDIFTTTTEYVLHVALPGAKKEDVGINWDAEKGVLNVAGVIYRQGDEEFLKQLSQGERKVGVFERAVKLPPRGQEAEEKEEVDGDGITAKLEDGVLVVKVPKVEREWTDVKKVDIQ